MFIRGSGIIGLALTTHIREPEGRFLHTSRMPMPRNATEYLAKFASREISRRRFRHSGNRISSAPANSSGADYFIGHRRIIALHSCADAVIRLTRMIMPLA